MIEFAVDQKMTESWDVVVVGSCMIDLICYAPRLPKSGETLRGTNFKMGFGGKGCNQCVAAKKLGANSILVARVGNDSFGKSYYEKLEGYKIPTKYFQITDKVSTGMAQITVADTGENHIVIIPGANNHLSERDIDDAADAIANCKVLVCQLEIPENITLRALQIKAASKIGKSILNAAPAKSNLNSLLFSLPDILCINESEAEIITGIQVSNPRTAELAISRLMLNFCKEVIITLGEEGSVYGKQGSSHYLHVPAIKVNAVDTTGAGDAFVGALAFYISKHPDMTMKEMLEKANFVAGVSVQKLGTQDSFPTLSDLVGGELNI